MPEFRVHYTSINEDWVVVEAEDADEATQKALDYEIWGYDPEITDVYEV